MKSQAARKYVHRPHRSQQRQVAAVGFSVSLPESIAVMPTDPVRDRDGLAFRAVEMRTAADGTARLVGVFEVSVFRAALIMDRDGVLEEIASPQKLLAPPLEGRVLDSHAIDLPGGSGFRTDVLLIKDGNGRSPPPCPYVTTIALGHIDPRVSAGLLVVLHQERAEWPAAEEMLQSLQFVD